jgi:hypothetical protein
MSETKLRVNWENKKSTQKLVFPLYIVIDILTKIQCQNLCDYVLVC